MCSRFGEPQETLGSTQQVLFIEKVSDVYVRVVVMYVHTNATNRYFSCISVCSIESFMYSPAYDELVKKVGRPKAFNLLCSGRERFSVFCKDKGKCYTDLNIRVNAYFLILYCSGTNHGNIIIKVIYMNEYHTGKAIEILTIPDFMRGLR